MFTLRHASATFLATESSNFSQKGGSYSQPDYLAVLSLGHAPGKRGFEST